MRSLKVVGIVAQNKALGSILAMMLKDTPDVRVRVFETHKALQVYLRIAPIHLLLCDYQLDDMSCPQLVSSVKSNPQMHTENMQIIALTRNVNRAMQREIGIAGIDEVIVKPTSPAIFANGQLRALSGLQNISGFQLKAPGLPLGLTHTSKPLRQTVICPKMWFRFLVKSGRIATQNWSKSFKLGEKL